MAKDHLPETGFAQDDLVGQSGLEEQYNAELSGKPGTDIVSVNAAGDVLGTVGGTAATTGDTLVTSINSKVQAIAQQALSSAIARSRAAGNAANQGAAVVETTSGRIVAMASYPDYNLQRGPVRSPSRRSTTCSARRPVRRRSLRARAELGDPGRMHAPGSTFKASPRPPRRSVTASRWSAWPRPARRR